MNAGTSSPRITVASIRTASARPVPNIWMNETLPVASAANTIAISTAAAHGAASLLITKPHLPFGEPEDFVYRVLGAAAMGRSVSQYLLQPTAPDFTEWRNSLPPRD